VIGGKVNNDDFLTAIGEAAQDAVWQTPHPLTHHLAEDDARRVQYLREYQIAVGRRILMAIAQLQLDGANDKGLQRPPATASKAKLAS
jgi:hypothetical protein